MLTKQASHHWNYSFVVEMDDGSVTALLGMSKERWNMYLGHLQLHGAESQWPHAVTDWRTGYTLSQLKLRQNLIFTLLEKMFRIEKSTCSRIFHTCIQFQQAVALEIANCDAREYSDQMRIDGLRYDHHNLEFSSVQRQTDANETPTQQFKNSETHHQAHSAYYDDQRIKHQAAVNASADVVWWSRGYLARECSDQALLEHGQGPASFRLAGRKFLDFLKGK